MPPGVSLGALGRDAWRGGQRKLLGEMQGSQVLKGNEEEAREKWRHSTPREQPRQNKESLVGNKTMGLDFKTELSELPHCRKGGGDKQHDELPPHGSLTPEVHFIHR